METDITVWTRPDTSALAFPMPVEHNSELCGLRFGEAGGQNVRIYFRDRASVEGLHAILGDFLRTDKEVRRTLTDPLLQIAQPEELI